MIIILGRFEIELTLKQSIFAIIKRQIKAILIRMCNLQVIQALSSYPVVPATHEACPKSLGQSHSFSNLKMDSLLLKVIRDLGRMRRRISPIDYTPLFHQVAAKKGLTATLVLDRFSWARTEELGDN